MVSERQRIEAPPSPSIENSMPPPSYEEVNGMFSPHSNNGSTDAMGYFLGEVFFYILHQFQSPADFTMVNANMICYQVMYQYQSVSDTELSLDVGDYVVVRKVRCSTGFISYTHCKPTNYKTSLLYKCNRSLIVVGLKVSAKGRQVGFLLGT